jgi:3-oxoadipate enol-lactonase
MAFFEHEHGQHYFQDFGHGAPVVCLHGLGNTGRVWAPQLQSLLMAGHRAIIPDLIGHGVSSDAQKGITLADQAVTIIALLDHLGLESTDVVGLSLGAMVALELSSRFPTVVTKLVVAGGFSRMDDQQSMRAIDEWIQALNVEEGCLRRFKQTWLQLVGPDFVDTPQGLAVYQAWHAQAAVDNPKNHIRWCEGLRHYNVESVLCLVKAKTLVLSGANDQISPRVCSEGMAAGIPGSELLEIPGQGHVFNVSSNGGFNDALGDFLREPAHV